MIQSTVRQYRSRFLGYSDLKGALSYKEEGSAYYQSLNGQWGFNYVGSPEETPTAFLEGQYQELDWEKIEVPGHIELQGYGQPMYSNFDYPFPVTPPELPADNPTGLYWCKFQRNFSENRLTLRFEGVDSAFEVWLNGKFVGESQGSRLMSEFDVTTYLKAGENEIGIRVKKWSLGSYLEDQDMWWLSGIFRDVTIIEESPVIDDLKITPQKENNQWQIRVDISHSGQEALQVSSQIYLAGKLLSERALKLQHGSNPFIFSIEAPQLWSNELPNLYTFVLVVNQSLFIPVRFGLREIKMIDNVMHLNDQPLLFNGVNRHEFDSQTGRTLSKQAIYEEVKQIKRHHINAIRTAHYPNHPYFYDVCDELGMLVIDECDIETHGFSQETAPAKDPFWEREFVERGLRMVHRDYNHPCILIWSLGNESHFGQNFIVMAEQIRALDSSRLIHYEGDRHIEVVDMYSTMYTSIADMQKRASLKINKRPHILCEYGHAMGNGPGSLKEYQELFKLYDSIQGGFIWEWKDHGLQRNVDGQSYFAYGGDFGETVHDGDFVIDGLVLPDGQPSPGLQDYQQVIQPFEFYYHQNTIGIKSLYHYQTLDNYSIIWEIQEQGILIESGTLKLPRLVPGKISELIKLPITKIVSGEAYLTLSLIQNQADQVFDQGESIARYQVRYQQCQKSDVLLDVSETTSELKIKANQTIFIFNKQSGQLKQIEAQGQEILAAEMQLGLWRQPISNDMYVKKAWESQYLDQLTARSRSFDYECREDSCLIVSRQYVAPPVVDWGIETEQVIWVTADGLIDINVKGWFDGTPPQDIPRIGYDLPLAQKIQTINWFGRGPGDSYPDSQNSAFFGKYQLDWQNWQFPYIVPQETGNRSDVSWAHILLENQYKLLITASKNFHFNAVPEYSKAELQAGNRVFLGDATEKNAILRIDQQVRGLGSNSCGPEPLEDYKVQPKPFEHQFSLAIVPIK